MASAAAGKEDGRPRACHRLGSDHARFNREARAASRLESEHVARVLDVGRTSDGSPYMVMEHLNGIDLAERLAKNGALAIDAAVTYVLETCEAIAEAHALGIVHRDLKPANLFLVRRRDGTEIVKVLDFGISKISEPLDDASRPPTVTDAKAVMGSLPYMSPEQLQASSRVDPRSDVWSVGIVLHELLTASRPFDGESATTVAAPIAASEPRRLREVRPDAPELLEAAILKCLEKDPSRRFPDLAAFARALGPVASAEARGSIERVTRLLGSSEASVARPSATAESALPTDVPPVRSKRPILAGAPYATDALWSTASVSRSGTSSAKSRTSRRSSRA